MLVIDRAIAVVVRHVALGMTMVVFEVDRVVVSLHVDPLVQIRLPMLDAACRSFPVLFDIGPGIEVEVIVELGVRATDSEDAELGGKGTVIDIGRSVEIPAGRQITKLHHP